jgi:glycerol-3-phosphate acyltransferase PlsX
MVKIIVDAMGGDYAPKQQVAGAVDALNQDKELALVLVGDETQIKAELADKKYDASRLEIVHTTETITMEEVPTKAVKTKKDSSLVVAFRMLKEGKGDGLVSSGSTGAVLTAGVLILGRLKGVSRPALCPSIPNHKGTVTLICDCGANLECKPINLVHFALMATAYSQSVYGVENPSVGLLNNGTEDHKGLLLQQETNAILKRVDCVNYAGNVEARDLMYGEVDVIVSDGFTGNIATKAVEGCGKAVSTIMKRSFTKNLWAKLRALLCGDIVKNIKKGLDYEACGGATFLGLSKPVVKGHGNSRARGFAVCIRQAANAAKNDLTGKLSNLLSKVDMEKLAAQAMETQISGGNK